MAWTEHSTSTKLHIIARFIIRILQFVLGLTIIGLYASELKATHDSSRYIYAVVVGTLSAITAIVMVIPHGINTCMFFPWDFVLFLLNTALFGAMGVYFINPKTKTRQHDTKMRNAVWIDCISMMLWFITFVVGCVLFLKARKVARTLHTGRATV